MTLSSTEYNELKASDATRDELLFSNTWPGYPNGGVVINEGTFDSDSTLFVAPFELIITSVDVIREYGTPPSTSTDNLEILLRKRLADGSVPASPEPAYMVSKTTYEQPMVGRTPWSLNDKLSQVADSTGYKTLQAGQFLQIGWRCNGNATMRFPFTVTVKYRPL